MKPLFAIRLILSLHFAAGFQRRAPIFTRGPTVKRVNLGGSVSFICEAFGDPMPVLYWEFNGRPINTGDHYESVNSIAGLSILKIMKATASMAGPYCCNADNGYGLREYCGTLRVRRAPVITASPQSQNISLGDGLVLKCTTDGYPVPVVQWYHNESMLDCLIYKQQISSPCARYSLSSSNSLKISHVHGSDAGKYICTASNGFGSSTSNTAIVTVMTPSPDVTSTAATQTTHTVTSPVDNHSKFTEVTFMEGYHNHMRNISESYEIIIPESPDEKSFLNRGSFIMIIGFLGSFLFFSLILFKICKRRRKRARRITMRILDAYTRTRHDREKMKQQALNTALDKLSYPVDKLNIIEELGEGVFGLVFKARAPDLSNAGQSSIVAVKTIRDNSNTESVRVEDFEREAELLSDFHHENIVQLLGVCFADEIEGDHRTISCLLFEYVDGGDLCAYLRCLGPNKAIFGNPSPASSPEEPTSITDLDKLTICTHIARGMKYLSERNFLHRDLATRNCLISSVDQVVKIADFGLSRQTYESDYYKASEAESVPIRWMAPESILYGRYSPQSDVWAFGVTVWEIYSYALQPYFTLTNEEVICTVCQGKILYQPTNTPTWMYNLMQLCWHNLPEKRPNFSTICSVLEAILSNDGELPLHELAGFTRDSVTPSNTNEGYQLLVTPILSSYPAHEVDLPESCSTEQLHGYMHLHSQMSSSSSDRESNV